MTPVFMPEEGREIPADNEVELSAFDDEFSKFQVQAGFHAQLYF